MLRGLSNQHTTHTVVRACFRHLRQGLQRPAALQPGQQPPPLCGAPQSRKGASVPPAQRTLHAAGALPVVAPERIKVGMAQGACCCNYLGTGRTNERQPLDGRYLPQVLPQAQWRSTRKCLLAAAVWQPAWSPHTSFYTCSLLRCTEKHS